MSTWGYGGHIPVEGLRRSKQTGKERIRATMRENLWRWGTYLSRAPVGLGAILEPPKGGSEGDLGVLQRSWESLG